MLFAEDGVESGGLTTIDPALVLVVEAWPTLPEAIRAEILAMIRGARPRLCFGYRRLQHSRRRRKGELEGSLADLVT